MSIKSKLSLPERFSVLIHSHSSNPCAIQFETQPLFQLLLVSCLILIGLSTGTLLFFRELETNRKLSEEILGLQNRYTLLQLGAVAPSGNPGATSAALPEPVTNTAVATISPDKPEAEPKTHTPVRARLGDFTVDCLEGNCSVRLGLVPSAPGAASGKLLVILEVEVPRIGVGNPTSPVRRKYLIYPGNVWRDELNPDEVTQIPGKEFRFARALQSQVPFVIDKTLLPVAANAYLFDETGALVQHERKAIKTGE